MTDTFQNDLTRQEQAAAAQAAEAQRLAAEQRQADADKAEADAKQAEEDAKAQAEYDAQPRVRLQKILNGLHGNHFDVRDHLGVLTRALVALVGTLHDAAPEVQPLTTREPVDPRVVDPDNPNPPPAPRAAPWPRQ